MTLDLVFQGPMSWTYSVYNAGSTTTLAWPQVQDNFVPSTPGVSASIACSNPAVCGPPRPTWQAAPPLQPSILQSIVLKQGQGRSTSRSTRRACPRR